MAVNEALDQLSVKTLARLVAEIEQEREVCLAGEPEEGQQPLPPAVAQPVTFIDFLSELEADSLKQAVGEIKATLASKLAGQVETIEMTEYEE